MKKIVIILSFLVIALISISLVTSYIDSARVRNST